MRYIPLVLVIIFAISGCDRPPEQNGPPPQSNSMVQSKTDHSYMESSPNAASAPYELQFIDTMIAHHQGAIDMSQLVQTRAQHPELKKLAAEITDAQQKEIGEMRSWRESAYAGAAPAVNMDLPGMHQGMAEMDLAKLDKLKENDFDIEFIRQMVPHHEGAVAMAKDALARIPAPQDGASGIALQIRTLCQNVVDSQENEIKEMRKWQEQWKK